MEVKPCTFLLFFPQKGEAVREELKRNDPRKLKKGEGVSYLKALTLNPLNLSVSEENCTNE